MFKCHTGRKGQKYQAYIEDYNPQFGLEALMEAEAATGIICYSLYRFGAQIKEDSSQEKQYQSGKDKIVVFFEIQAQILEKKPLIKQDKNTEHHCIFF